MFSILTKDDFEYHLETDFLIREFMFQHVWNNVLEIISDKDKLEKTIKEIKSNEQKIGI